MIYSKDTFHLSPLPPGGIFPTSDGPGISSLRSNEVIVTTTNLAKCLNVVIMKIRGCKLSSWQVLTWWQNGRILIQLEHHFLHLYVDIQFVTYKTRSNQSLQFQSTYQVQLLDRLFAALSSEIFHVLSYLLKFIFSQEICFWPRTIKNLRICFKYCAMNTYLWTKLPLLMHTCNDDSL